MSEHDRSHPQWHIPPAGAAPDPGTVPSAALPAASTPEVVPPSTAAGGPPIDRPRGRWRRTTGRPLPRRRRRLVTAAVGLTLLLGGGTAGFALAAGDGPNRGGAVPTAEDGHERPDRGGPAGARGDLDG